jgi:cation-transporting P-type ATPase 13A2
MLTGESIPIVKTPLSKKNEIYSDKFKINTLYSGTEVLSSNTVTRAYVYRTGFFTAKGNLLLSILYPKSSHFSMYSDSLKFVAFMSIFAFLGMIYSSIVLYLENATIWDRVIKVLDIITIAVPPSLPLALTIGLSYSSWRLSRKKIFCISPQRINVSGMINHVCFDKTGTLTFDSLNLLGILPIGETGQFQELIEKENIKIEASDIFHTSLMSCHGLGYVNDIIVGDPLEIEIYNSTNSKLEEDIVINLDSNVSVSILKRFEFLSELQRMSVIVGIEKERILFTKGSPEIFKTLANVETLPNDYDSVLESLTKKGYRVLSIGMKSLEDEIEGELKREDFEFNLKFLGFIILQNKVKPSTRETIRNLNEVHISSVMVTGDNPRKIIQFNLSHCNIHWKRM